MNFLVSEIYCANKRVLTFVRNTWLYLVNFPEFSIVGSLSTSSIYCVLVISCDCFFNAFNAFWSFDLFWFVFPLLTDLHTSSPAEPSSYWIHKALVVSDIVWFNSSNPARLFAVLVLQHHEINKTEKLEDLTRGSPYLNVIKLDM